MSRLPQYPKRPHKGGQARIKIRGKDVWLGRWNSPESLQKFARIIAELAASSVAPSAPSTAKNLTAAELIDAFREWAEKRYVKNGKQTRGYLSSFIPAARRYFFRIPRTQ